MNRNLKYAVQIKRFTTHFGFKNVLLDEKESLVKNVFSNVASKYDIMNDVMSFGIHRLWKSHYVSKIAPGPSSRLLDVAGGTGDIAFRLLNNVKHNHGSFEDVNCTVLDINPDMLSVGRQRAIELGFNDEKVLNFIEGNAEKLESIESDSIDSYTIAFGIRNCTNIDKVLEEAFRVLKRGGRFTCLEFSQVNNPIIKTIYDRYSMDVIPEMGHLVANQKESYQYLVESIRQFPSQPEFKNMIEKAGFKVFDKGWEDLTFGVAAIHTGWKM